MRKQPERKAKTKQALKDSFWRLYCVKPIEKITVNAVTEGAGVYRSTFYEYYPDVYAVREETEETLLETYLSFICLVQQTNSLSDTTKLLLEFYTANSEQLAVLLGPHGDPEFLKKLKTYLKKMVHERLKVPANDIETEILVEMGSAAVISMLNYWYEHRDTLAIEDVINGSSHFLQHGLVPYIEKWVIK